MIGLSMRRMRWKFPNGNIEIRDGLDAGWWRFLEISLPEYPVIPLPNIGDRIVKILESIKFSGFILTGGDDWGIFPERDLTETAIYNFAEKYAIPVLGICRGAQLINTFFNGVNSVITDHVGTRHNIFLCNRKKRQVNSFHNYGIKTLGAGLTSIANDEMGFVEAFSDNNHRVYGVMWHPERENIPDFEDIDLVHNLFDKVSK